MWVYGGALIPDDPEPVGVRRLAAADPAFDLAAFLDLARTVHRNVHAAVATCDLAPVRGILAEPLADELVGRRGRSWTAIVDEHVHTAVIDAAPGSRDRITVRLGASIGGRATVEDWTFERDGRPDDSPRAGLPPTACLSCGAPLSTDERGDCRYCGTHLLGVAGRWQVSAVVAPRIIDPVRPDQTLAGLDPTFRRDAFLAFAGDAYARIHRAVADGRVDEVGEVLTAEVRQQLATGSPDLDWHVGVVAASHVELVDAQHGALDRLTVRFVAPVGGSEVVEDWTFERPAPARGEAPPPPTTCPCCGAPIGLDEDGRCRYCGAHLLGVAGGWRLAAVSPPPTEMVSNPTFVRAMQRPGCQLLLAAGVLAVLVGSIAAVVLLVVAAR